MTWKKKIVGRGKAVRRIKKVGREMTVGRVKLVGIARRVRKKIVRTVNAIGERKPPESEDIKVKKVSRKKMTREKMKREDSWEEKYSGGEVTVRRVYKVQIFI